MEKIDFTLKNKYLLLFNLISHKEKIKLDEITNNLKPLSVGHIENEYFSILVFTESCYESVRGLQAFKDLYRVLGGHYNKTVNTTYDLMKYIGDYGKIFYHIDLGELHEIMLNELEQLIRNHTRPEALNYSNFVEYLVRPATFIQMFVDSTIKARKIQIKNEEIDDIDYVDDMLNCW